MANIRFETIKAKSDCWQVLNGKLRIGRMRKRGESVQVDLGRSLTGGRRQQKSFRSRQEAAVWIENSLREFNEHGREAFEFTAEQRRICLSALAELEGFPPGALIDAARFYREYHDPKAEKRTVNELLAEFLESKRASGKAADTLRDYSARLGYFAREHGGTFVHTLTPQALEKWLTEHGVTGTNRANYRRHLTVFLNYAVKRGYCKGNAAAATEAVRIKRGLPVILNATEVTRLLKTAQKQAPKMVPYFCLGLFAGLRPDEITRLDWRNVDLEKREIYIAHDATKTADDRYVAMSDNLVEWLLPFRRERGLVVFSRALFDKVREKAKVPWANDVMRHTFASHHCPIHGTDETADQLGHKGKSVLFKHYRRAVTKRDAEKYWEIRPGVGKVIALEVTA